ncbi:hypothetical protein PF003_g5067 [Phytophthora fragariae]|nr:hypothetical protein PF003_g5067 [Phytophthora fragariae]
MAPSQRRSQALNHQLPPAEVAQGAPLQLNLVMTAKHVEQECIFLPARSDDELNCMYQNYLCVST